MFKKKSDKIETFQNGNYRENKIDSRCLFEN